MAATPPVNSFFRRGKSKIYFLPAVAAPQTGPTSIELTGGTDLSPAVQAINGFAYANTPIDSPDLSSTFTAQIPGEDKADNSSLTFKDDQVSAAIRSALAKGTTGFIILMPYGNVTTKRCEVWPVTSTGFNDQWAVDNNPAQAMAQFAVTSPPNQAAALP